MKDPTLRRADRGAALVVTLTLLLLFTIVVIAFFGNVTTETRTAKTFADSVSTRQLAESAVGMIESQIRSATTVPNGAWATQPGMIRVYGDDGKPSDRAHAFYKLYSSDRLVVPASELPSFDADKEVPDDWSAQPALWTDLNEPVRKTDANGNIVARYPILNPEAAGKVEGFDLQPPDEESANPARMPVRWLYVLRDGTVTAPDRATEDGDGALWDAPEVGGRRVPTRANPIVGRVAFWTDDDTNKVNINTAGGFTTKDLGAYNESNFAGSFWDTPRFSTVFDRGGVLDENSGSFSDGEGGLAICQPLGNEFQRYPGHPSTTSLGLVLANSLKPETLYSLLPRLNPGGSMGGRTRLFAQANTALPIKTHRLYASVDEFFFATTAKNGERQSASEAARSIDPSDETAITPEWVDQMRFFLTAHNRAPELNLFGRPRMSIWPVWTDQLLRNPEDRLIAFCSTLGPAKDTRPFILQRQDPYSSTVDAQIARNAALYNYLRELTSQPVPGYGSSSFATKYGTDRDQILTEIFDYIRSANLRDSTRNSTLATPAEREKYQFAPRGIVVPLTFTRDGRETMGFGRFPSISEVALVFYHAGYIPAAGGAPYDDPTKKATFGVSANLVKAFVVLEMLNPMQGYAPIRPFGEGEANNRGRIIVHELTGLDRFTISTSVASDIPLGFPSSAKNRNRFASSNVPTGRNFGGSEGFMHRLREKEATNPASADYYPFQTPAPVAIPVNDATFGFNGGPVTLRVLFGNLPMQTLRLDFPSGSFPTPTDDIWDDPGGFTHSTATLTDVKSLPKRIAWAVQPNSPAGFARRWKQILQPGDTIRSLVAGIRSDPRTTAISRDTAPFAPHPLYGNSSTRHAQTLRTAVGNPYMNGRDLLNRVYRTRFGNLVAMPAGHDYEVDRSPDLPEGLDGVVRTDGLPGDWDTGIGNMSDGPYCGKPDEGNLAWRRFNQNEGRWDYVHPYYAFKFEDTLDTFFSPNRQMSSPVMFGSLLAGRARDWQTLAFSPNPAGENHPGNTGGLKDHLLLDLFHMPIVEPYAISEPFSTAGKVNLNFQLAPFPWIKRTTALRAVLHASRVTAVPAQDVEIYKDGMNQKPITKNYRYRVNRDETIKGLENVFEDYRRLGPDRGFFKSASDICERFLYPESPTNAGTIHFDQSENGIRTFWKLNTLTGDNLREKPYSDLMPRLTTKSNSFTVHFRVQTLRQRSSTDEARYREWRATENTVVGEYRGETSIERYIDPDDRRFDRANTVTVRERDFLDVDRQSLEGAYRFRVVSSKRFLP